ncbi:hypothetical protein OS493_029248 [Desmophyllum pertusum]|uniref:DED domain-containing protein n=1 Tax=Desmophyllum pertusum TaxID=174260 RepID=A0A9W9ZK98_9CNID|nr:hypothetical protein OS493_029248 [Desmophyllum pertusum]
MLSSSLRTVTDKLRQAYKGVLLQISHNLDREHQKELRYYCSGLIPMHDTDTIDILRALEHEGKISWEDVDLLKDALCKIIRLDMVKKLTDFEIKRDLTLLLDFYVRKIQGLDLCCRCSVGVKRVAGHLVRLMEIVRDTVDIRATSLTVESSNDIRRALVEFDEEFDSGELTFSAWNEFTMLVLIAGEIIAVASEKKERREPVVELCFAAADELCSRMTEMGSWEEFCVQVKERYNLVYHRNMESNPCLSLQKRRAEVVQQLAAIFFPVDKGYN